MRSDAANAADPTFDTLMAEVMVAAHRFGHRHHFDAHPGVGFDAFVDLNPAVLGLAPFPWQRFASRDPRADQWRWRPSSRNRFCRPRMQSAARFRHRLGGHRRR
jgi:hypothetical protein